MGFKRLPNNFGSIQEVKWRNLRKPFRARKLIRYEFDEETMNVKAIYKTIGWFETRKQAMESLAAFTPSQETIEDYTFKQVWEKCNEERRFEKGDVYDYSYHHTFEFMKSLHNKKMSAIRTIDIEHMLRTSKIPRTYKRWARLICGIVYRYAMSHDICDKDYSRLVSFNVDNKTKLERNVFTKEEAEQLFNDGSTTAEMVLFGIYTGFRPGEICAIRTEDIDGSFIRGGSKTEAGKDRLVPIHDAIRPIVDKYASQNKGLLFNVHYETYYTRFKELCPSHTPHDTRHTFATYSRVCDMDSLVVKWILGHSATDLTEKVYTHKQKDLLLKEMAKYRVE